MQLKQVKPTAQSMARTLYTLITTESGASWAEIMATVGSQYKVTNWLTQVRGPLQWLINNGYVQRVELVRHEAYKWTGKVAVL